MTILQKTFVALVVVLAIVGGYFYPSVKNSVSFIGSPSGTTFNNAKVATIVMDLSSATTTNLLNTDASARKVESWVVDCTGLGTSYTAVSGAGLAGLSFTFATSSSAVGHISNTNSIVVPVATSTPTTYNFAGNSTSTARSLAGQWPSGAYLSIESNATNTASCVAGVNYLAS